jgi:hypothetical protein
MLLCDLSENHNQYDKLVYTLRPNPGLNALLVLYLLPAALLLRPVLLCRSALQCVPQEEAALQGLGRTTSLHRRAGEQRNSILKSSGLTAWLHCSMSCATEQQQGVLLC